MNKLQPIALRADGDNSYKVRFETGTAEVEFVFKVDEEQLRTLSWDPEYSKLADGDPAALALNKAIFEFHRARHFEEQDCYDLAPGYNKKV